MYVNYDNLYVYIYEYTRILYLQIYTDTTFVHILADFDCSRMNERES